MKLEITRLRSSFNAIWEGRRDRGGSANSPLQSILPSYHSNESLNDAAAAQITDGFTFSRHRGSVIVIKLVLLGLPNEFTCQVEEKFLHIVGLFGWGFQVQHALRLSKVFSPLSDNLPLLCQVDFISCGKTQQPLVDRCNQKAPVSGHNVSGDRWVSERGAGGGARVSMHMWVGSYLFKENVSVCIQSFFFQTWMHNIKLHSYRLI